MPPKKAPEPVELSTPKLIGHGVLLLLCIALLAVGSLGMHVLLDAENTSPVTRSQFGQLYRRLIAMNPFFSAMFVNGGLIGTLYAAITLSGHRAALKKTKASAAAGVKKEETKKDK